MIDFDLTTVWAFIIAFAVFMYVVMDGFDLGIGILFPLPLKRRQPWKRKTVLLFRVNMPLRNTKLFFRTESNLTSCKLPLFLHDIMI